MHNTLRFKILSIVALSKKKRKDKTFDHIIYKYSERYFMYTAVSHSLPPSLGGSDNSPCVFVQCPYSPPETAMDPTRRGCPID